MNEEVPSNESRMKMAYLSSFVRKATKEAGRIKLSGNVELLRADECTEFQVELVRPVVCLILQGEKIVRINGESKRLAAGRFFLCALDMPIDCRVSAAPYLAVSLPLDHAIIAELILALQGEEKTAQNADAAGSETVSAVDVREADAVLLDAVVRKCRALESGASTLWQTLIDREIHLHLLEGGFGSMLKSYFSSGKSAYRIAGAVSYINSHFAERIEVSALAARFFMSDSTFHRLFKAATGQSPIQFQKKLRLKKAKELIGSLGEKPQAAAYAVGYTNVSQFSREYRRLHGESPRETQRRHGKGNV